MDQPIKKKTGFPPRTQVKLICPQCGAKHSMAPGDYKHRMRMSVHKVIYCSLPCAGEGLRKHRGKNQ